MVSPSPIEQLHKSYKAGKLRLLVGAGTGIPAGFPSWQRLCLGLMEGYLADKYASQTLVSRGQVRELSEGLLEVLGRDAAADFVRIADPDRFHERLADALYDGRYIDELPVLSTHCQLGALALGSKNPGSFLFTTNYDPMVELALAYLMPGSNWRHFRRYGVGVEAESADGRPLIHHVHGWVDPDGDSGGTVVLTETHYLELQRENQADPNRLLQRLLTDEGSLLIVGMSLADPNLKRLLYVRKRDELRPANQRVYVVLRRRDPVLDGYLVEHWRSWKINIVHVDGYDDVPGLLRDVAWGEASTPAWLAASRNWMRQRVGDLLFDDRWQELAYNTLRALAEQLRVWFALPVEERVDLAIFAPLLEDDAGPAIGKVASSKRCRTGVEARAHMERRRLSVERKHEQGVAGLAFGTGTTREVLDDGDGLNLNFSPEMVRTWDVDEGYREWRSVLAIPVLDSTSWLPMAVITVTSNLPRPFWASFGERAERSVAELKKMLRHAAKWLFVRYRESSTVGEAP